VRQEGLETPDCQALTYTGMLTNVNLVLVLRLCQDGVMYLRMFHLPESSETAKSVDIFSEPVNGRSWTNAKHASALADSERHFGHVVKTGAIKTGQWHAWDATHVSDASERWNYLGPFADRNAAMQAVESAVSQIRESKTMRAAVS
jgi:hypothetical protein